MLSTVKPYSLARSLCGADSPKIMNEMDGNKYKWGDSVIVKDIAPPQFCPGQIVSVCGMIKVKTKSLADKYQCNMGDWIYTVEYIGGTEADIPECYLEKYEESE